MRPAPVLRFLRVSNTLTIPADIVAGACAGFALRRLGPADALLQDPLALLLACIAALGIYHGGMAHNDLADLAVDRELRPDRPLPSGALSRTSALAVLGTLWSLFALATLALAFQDPAAAILLLALFLSALAYNLGARRSRWSGPPLLGLCRALDLGVGLAVSGALGSAATRLAAWSLAGAFGLYVGSLSALARMEDAQPSPAACRHALLIAALGFLAPLLLLPGPLWALPLAIGGAAFILRELFRPPSAWTRARVGRAVGRLLRLILVFDAALCAGSGALALALILLAAYPITAWLARTIPPT